MFDFIKKMFGEGKIRTEVHFDDGSFIVVKVPYIGDINTLDATELRETIRQRMLVDYGKRTTTIHILGWY